MLSTVAEAALSMGGWHSCDDKLVSCRAQMQMHREAEEVQVAVPIHFPLPLFSFVLDSSLWDTALAGGGSCLLI